VFSRAWRRLERPEPTEAISPDELELLKARDALAKFGTIWRDPKVPDRLREQAVHELFVRFDVEGGTLVAAHPQPNENAWLIGQALMNAGLWAGHARTIAAISTPFASRYSVLLSTGSQYR